MKQAMAALKPATRKWLASLQGRFVLEDYHLRLLISAGLLWDRAAACREVLARDGPMVLDRFSQKKAHPALEVERQSLVAFSRLLREVGLDIEQRPDDSRPPTRPGGY